MRGTNELRHSKYRCKGSVDIYDVLILLIGCGIGLIIVARYF